MRDVVGVCVGDEVRLRVAVGDCVGDPVGVPLSDGVDAGLAESDGDDPIEGDCEGDTKKGGEADGVTIPLNEGVPVPVAVGVSLPVGVALDDVVAESELLPLVVAVLLDDGVPLAVVEGLAPIESGAVLLDDSDRESVPVVEGVPDAVTVADEVTELVGDGDAVGDTVSAALLEAVGDALGVS